MMTRARYTGPKHLTDDITLALNTLSEQLAPSYRETKTHTVLFVEKFADSETLEATAIYLVGAIAVAIDQNLCLRETLYKEDRIVRELSDDVLSVIRDVDVDAEYKTMVRDPWLWEGISHMFVHLSTLNSDFHPSGAILVKTSIKHDVHDHGLDLISIYRGTDIGLSAGECKAYLDNPARGIRDASKILGEIDANLRDKELRSTVTQLRHALAPADKEQIAGAFWRNERSYLPFVCCDVENSCNWTSSRTSLNRLQIPAKKRILVPLSLEAARDVFDSICSLMREYSTWEG